MEIDKEPTPVIKGNIEKNVTIFVQAILNLLTTSSSQLITFYCLLFHIDVNRSLLLSRAQAYLKPSKINKMLLTCYFFVIYKKQHPQHTSIEFCF